MKTIALLSGGKDSILAVLMAYRYGHEPVVIVNMAPLLECEDASVEKTEAGVHGHEIDSYMYQTVGFEAVEGIAACLGLPLRRAYVRRGGAKDQSLLYSENPPEGDEVESLFKLINLVKEEFPEVQGLTSGAILSNYQRTRVEHICDRLGLESLAYLWMREPDEILDMAEALHVRAILVKTASIGLMPRRLIGKTLEEARPTLEKMTELYQSHLAGEGGEYETTVLSCPLFHSEQLTVTSLEVVMQDDNDISPSGHGVLAVTRVPKATEQQAQERELLMHLRAGNVTFPSDVMPLLRSLSSFSVSATPSPSTACEISASTALPISSNTLFLEACVPAAGAGVEHHSYTTLHESGTSIAEALDTCLATLQAWAQERDLTAFYYHISVPESSWEASCRSVYAAKVSHVCPPGLLVTARAGNPLLSLLEAEVLAAPRESIKQVVLHAQSRSCWAFGEPGPYSQARRVYLPSGASQLFLSAAPGRLAPTGEVATAADLPATCRQRLEMFLAETHREGQSGQGVVDTLAQFLFAMANCERYLAFFGCTFEEMSRATLVVTEDVPVALLPVLWSWSTQSTKTLPYERAFQVVVVGALPGKEKIRISMTCAEEGEGRD